MGRDYFDQSKFFDPTKRKLKAHIIGLGTNGQAVLQHLAGLGITNFDLYDNDEVEARNLSAQWVFRPSDVGEYKVVAAMKWLQRQEYDDVHVQIWRRRVTEDTPLDGIVIGCVDSTESRKAVLAAVKKCDVEIDLYIDTSLGGPWMHVYSLLPYDPEMIERYEEYLYGIKPEADELECGARAFPGASMRVGNEVMRNIVSFVSTGTFTSNIREHLAVPYARINSLEEQEFQEENTKGVPING